MDDSRKCWNVLLFVQYPILLNQAHAIRGAGGRLPKHIGIKDFESCLENIALSTSLSIDITLSLYELVEGFDQKLREGHLLIKIDFNLNNVKQLVDLDVFEIQNLESRELLFLGRGLILQLLGRVLDSLFVHFAILTAEFSKIVLFNHGDWMSHHNLLRYVELIVFSEYLDGSASRRPSSYLWDKT